jgi:hypothetical protein
MTTIRRCRRLPIRMALISSDLLLRDGASETRSSDERAELTSETEKRRGDHRPQAQE